MGLSLSVTVWIIFLRSFFLMAMIILDLMFDHVLTLFVSYSHTTIKPFLCLYDLYVNNMPVKTKKQKNKCYTLTCDIMIIFIKSYRKRKTFGTLFSRIIFLFFYFFLCGLVIDSGITAKYNQAWGLNLLTKKAFKNER